jgi:hypothetical protein
MAGLQGTGEESQPLGNRTYYRALTNYEHQNLAVSGITGNYQANETVGTYAAVQHVTHGSRYEAGTRSRFTSVAHELGAASEYAAMRAGLPKHSDGIVAKFTVPASVNVTDFRSPSDVRTLVDEMNRKRATKNLPPLNDLPKRVKDYVKGSAEALLSGPVGPEHISGVYHVTREQGSTNSMAYFNSLSARRRVDNHDVWVDRTRYVYKKVHPNTWNVAHRLQIFKVTDITESFEALRDQHQDWNNLTPEQQGYAAALNPALDPVSSRAALVAYKERRSTAIYNGMRREMRRLDRTQNPRIARQARR